MLDLRLSISVLAQMQTCHPVAPGLGMPYVMRQLGWALSTDSMCMQLFELLLPQHLHMLSHSPHSGCLNVAISMHLRERLGTQMWQSDSCMHAAAGAAGAALPAPGVQAARRQSP